MDRAHECRVLEAREMGLSKACQTHGFSTFFAINPYYFGWVWVPTQKCDLGYLTHYYYIEYNWLLSLDFFIIDEEGPHTATICDKKCSRIKLFTIWFLLKMSCLQITTRYVSNVIIRKTWEYFRINSVQQCFYTIQKIEKNFFSWNWNQFGAVWNEATHTAAAEWSRRTKVKLKQTCLTACHVDEVVARGLVDFDVAISNVMLVSFQRQIAMLNVIK